MFASIISLALLLISVAALFVHAKVWGKCFYYPIQMKKQISTYKAVHKGIGVLFWLSLIALIISLIVWYYQWGMGRADNVVFVL